MCKPARISLELNPYKLFNELTESKLCNFLGWFLDDFKTKVGLSPDMFI
jgi:hypothetical protein